jgi:hypothetical protein
MDKNTLEERCAELKARLRSPGNQVNEDQPRAIMAGLKRVKRVSSVNSIIVAQPSSGPLRNPHPLVKAAIAATTDVQEDYGRLQFRHRGCIDIRVSKSLVHRALKLMDTFLKKLDAAGLHVAFAKEEEGYYGSFRRYSFVTDGRERVQVTLTEKTHQREKPAWSEQKQYSVHRYVHVSTGRLTLVLEDGSYRGGFRFPCKWADGRGRFVEDCIEQAIGSIFQILEAKRLNRIEAEEQRRREVERQRLRAEEERQAQQEEKLVLELKSMARNWKECEDLRAFVAAWEQHLVAKRGVIEPASEADGWQRWALRAIDQLDPFRIIRRNLDGLER